MVPALTEAMVSGIGTSKQVAPVTRLSSERKYERPHVHQEGCSEGSENRQREDTLGEGCLGRELWKVEGFARHGPGEAGRCREKGIWGRSIYKGPEARETPGMHVSSGLMPRAVPGPTEYSVGHPGPPHPTPMHFHCVSNTQRACCNQS